MTPTKNTSGESGLGQSDEDVELFESDPPEHLHRKLNFYEEPSCWGKDIRPREEDHSGIELELFAPKHSATPITGRLRQRLRQRLRESRAYSPSLHVSLIQASNDSEAFATRLQMVSVICTWYKPSRIAWLHHDRVSKALAEEGSRSHKDRWME